MKKKPKVALLFMIICYVIQWDEIILIWICKYHRASNILYRIELTIEFKYWMITRIKQELVIIIHDKGKLSLIRV